MNFKDKELIIFDFDGTLINSIPDLTLATNKMLYSISMNMGTYLVHDLKRTKIRAKLVELKDSREPIAVKKKQAIIYISKAFIEKNNNIFNLLGKRIANNLEKKNYIVTASPQLYVQMYFTNMIVIGTTFVFDADEVFNGLKFNCYGKNKVIALKRIGVSHIDEFFTDSFSDMPVMKISREVFLVKEDIIRRLQF